MSEGLHREPHRCGCLACRGQPAGDIAKEHRDINRLVASLDEKARRLFVAFLARQHGRGGIALFSRVTGLSRNTIRLGLEQFDQPPEHDGRIRRPGGGRPRVEKKVRASSTPSSAWWSRIPPAIP
jgi:hypothetical protein